VFLYSFFSEASFRLLCFFFQLSFKKKKKRGRKEGRKEGRKKGRERGNGGNLTFLN
jgi:hypothetical protein